MLAELSKECIEVVSGGMDADGCRSAAINGFGMGATVGGVIGSAFGPLGTGVGTLSGGLAGGALAVSVSPSCKSNAPNSSSGFGGVGVDQSVGGGNGPGGKVICTELCRNGVIEHDVWMADIRYSRDNFSAQTMRGYHLWGIPYVKLMRQYPAFAKVAAYPTRWFAADIAYRMGVRSKPNYAGWAVRELAFRPICWSLGIVAKARDWQSLWATPQAGLPNA